MGIRFFLMGETDCRVGPMALLAMTHQRYGTAAGAQQEGRGRRKNTGGRSGNPGPHLYFSQACFIMKPSCRPRWDRRGGKQTEGSAL